MSLDQPASSYVDRLPAILRQHPFLGRFLLAFEAILSGPGVAGQPGLEEVIERIVEYVDPQTTPEEFLDWLARWVALSLRADWDARTKREFVRQVVPLYRLRGTPEGMARMVGTYTGGSVTVDDAFDDLPHYFQVKLRIGQPDIEELRRKQEIARAIIDQEKPAHTYYALAVGVPKMRLVSLELQAREAAEGRRPDLLILGNNTILGSD